jgi:hypothetical protein
MSKLEMGPRQESRSEPARCTPATGDSSCTPAKSAAGRVPGSAEMPPLAGCNKQDYAVLFIVGTEIDS